MRKGQNSLCSDTFSLCGLVQLVSDEAQGKVCVLLSGSAVIVF